MPTAKLSHRPSSQAQADLWHATGSTVRRTRILDGLINEYRNAA